MESYDYSIYAICAEQLKCVIMKIQITLESFSQKSTCHLIRFWKTEFLLKKERKRFWFLAEKPIKKQTNMKTDSRKAKKKKKKKKKNNKASTYSHHMPCVWVVVRYEKKFKNLRSWLLTWVQIVA